MKLKEEPQRRKEWLSVPLGLFVLLILLAWALIAPGLSERAQLYGGLLAVTALAMVAVFVASYRHRLLQREATTNQRLRGEAAERERIQAALRQSEETARALLNAPSEAALLIETDGTIVALNEVARTRLSAIAGLDVDDPKAFVGRDVFAFFPSDLENVRRARNSEVLASGQPARFVDERSGLWMDNTIYPVVDEDEQVVRLAIFSRDITEHKRLEEMLKREVEVERERARRDPLTRALNHGGIMEELEALIAPERGTTPFILALADVDGMKQINDTYGHPAGDAALIALVKALSARGAVVGRYGGDEFIAVLPGADPAAAERYQERVDRALLNGSRRRSPAGKVALAASVGFAAYPGEAQTIIDLMRVADRAMYAEKRRRRSGRRAAPAREAAA
ncbi:MAG: sensor domain-containing diguanylate cyclase [Dehalococcoidia bacterium]